MIALNGYYDGDNVIIKDTKKPSISSKVKIIFLDVKTEGDLTWPDENAPQDIKLGLGKERISVPENIDTHNDKIAELFGV